MKKRNWNNVKWTPFEEASGYSLPECASDAEREAAKRAEKHSIILVNSIYQVEVSKVAAPPPFGDVIWLSIKTRDKQARHDWREFQRIKNEIVGPNVEAVEVYPDEDRLTDTSNQYHLWCFPVLDFPNGWLPFGYRERVIAEGSDPGSASGPGGRQRPFAPDARPPDTMSFDHVRKIGMVKLQGRCPICGSAFQPVTEGYRCIANNHLLPVEPIIWP